MRKWVNTRTLFPTKNTNASGQCSWTRKPPRQSHYIQQRSKRGTYPKIIYPSLQGGESPCIRDIKHQDSCGEARTREWGKSQEKWFTCTPPADAFRKNDLVIDLYISSPAVSQMFSLTSRILDSPVARSGTGTGTLSLLNAAPV